MGAASERAREELRIVIDDLSIADIFHAGLWLKLRQPLLFLAFVVGPPLALAMFLYAELSGGGPLQLRTLLVVTAVLVVVASLLPIGAALAAVLYHRRMGRVLVMVLDEHGVHRSTEGKTWFAPWPSIAAARETSRAFLLELGDGSYAVWPKRAIADPGALRRTLVARLGARARVSRPVA